MLHVCAICTATTWEGKFFDELGKLSQLILFFYVACILHYYSIDMVCTVKHMASSFDVTDDFIFTTSLYLMEHESEDLKSKEENDSWMILKTGLDFG